MGFNQDIYDAFCEICMAKDDIVELKDYIGDHIYTSNPDKKADANEINKLFSKIDYSLKQAKEILK